MINLVAFLTLKYFDKEYLTDTNEDKDEKEEYVII